VEKVTFRKQAKHGKHIYIYNKDKKKDKKKEQNYKKEKKKLLFKEEGTYCITLKKIRTLFREEKWIGKSTSEETLSLSKKFIH
jgi:hypothetical protein